MLLRYVLSWQINPESAAKTLAPPTVIDSESEEDEDFEEVVEVPYEYTEEELVWKEVTKEEVVERSLPQVKGMYPYSGQGLEMEKGEVGWFGWSEQDFCFNHSLLRSCWPLQMSHVSISFELLSRIVLSLSSILDRRLILSSWSPSASFAFLLLLSADYHNVLMCFSLWPA